MDSVRVSNPPSNPQLLDELAKRFTDYNYDFKNSFGTSVTRELINCRATTESNKDDLRNFARSHLRRLRAEVLGRNFTSHRDQEQIPGPASRSQGHSDRRRKSQQLLSHHLRAVYAGDGLFMRSGHGTTFLQALHLLNGEATNTRIKQGKVVSELLKEGKSPEAIGRSVCCSRKPRAAEKANLLAALVGSESPESNRWKSVF